MRTTKNLMWVSLAVLALFSSCSGKEDGAKSDEVRNDSSVVTAKESELPKIKIDTVREEAVPQLYEFTASVEPDVKNNIASAAPGRIVQIMTEVGKYVKKGQVLVKMDPTNLLNAKTQISNLEIDYKRIEELVKAGGASQQTLDQLKTQLDVARASYNNLQENTTLVSPVNGIVTARNYDNGDMYSGAQPILTVMQIRPVKVVINVSETYFSQIKVGMSVDVALDVYEGQTFKGKVSLIYPTIDQATRTFPVEINIPNNNEKIRPGMFARVTMNFGTKNRVVVPDLAIVKRAGSGDRFVYVYKDGKVSYNKVEIGRRMGAEYELISGVENGSTVVVSGQARLSDGAEAEVVE